jgi:hypothetical protein
VPVERCQETPFPYKPVSETAPNKKDGAVSLTPLKASLSFKTLHPLRGHTGTLPEVNDIAHPVGCRLSDVRKTIFLQAGKRNRTNLSWRGFTLLTDLYA